MKWRFWMPAHERVLPHVRYHVVHEGTDGGDVTVEGYETGGDKFWVFLDRAVLIEKDGARHRPEGGRFDVPKHRIVLREPLVAISLPELPEVVA